MQKNYFVILLLLVASVLFQNALIAQCYNDQHSNTATTSWLSCNATPNPNAARGTSHWIHYDFEDVYNLADTHVWNYNESGVTNRGIQTVGIDYSLDGINWTTLGAFQWTQATGNANYAGFSGPDFGGVNARYVLLTVISGFQANACYGFSEIRFNINDNTECIGLEASAIVDAPCINSNDGSAVVEVEGGQAPFDYAWSAGSNTAMQAGLSQGTYTVTITDNNNCQEAVVVQVDNDNSVPNPINDVPVPDDVYYNTEIISQGVVGYNSDVNYRASQCIELGSDFEVVQGGVFLAEIRNCGTPSNMTTEGEEAEEAANTNH